MFVKNLIDINKNDLVLAGGKGASLGEMLQNNIPVPGGFVLLSSAFDCFIAKNSLISNISNTLKNINYSSYTDIEKVSAQITNLILNTNLPEDLENQIITMYRKSNMEYVAVRSSATEEDNYLSTWAGQLDTFLNTDLNNLIENIKKCWASLYSPRAIQYRFQNKLQNKNISIAVVIQKMIQSEVSGICFTANPLTNNTSQLVIEAGFGLGESIVGGMITPDTYILDKNSNNNAFTMFSKKISTQTKQLIRRNNSITEIDVPKRSQDIQKLNDTNILELSNISNILEKHYNHPQDIEWCFDGHEIFILQSRPITTLSNTPYKNHLMDYIKNQKWSFGIKANESLLFYSAKQAGYKKYLLKEFNVSSPDSLFITTKDNYPIRVSNTNNDILVNAHAREVILNNPTIIISYINRNLKLWDSILNLCTTLPKEIEKKNYNTCKNAFLEIFTLYELASTLFKIVFTLGVELMINEDKFENIQDIISTHNNWRNSIAAKEDLMGESIYFYIKFIINYYHLNCSPTDIMNFLSITELTNLLNKTINTDKLNKIIEKRKNNGYVYAYTQNKIRIIDSNSTSNTIRKYFLTLFENSSQSINNNYLHGEVTYNSNKKIIGHVIIIKDSKDLYKNTHSLKNKILVAIQTTPQFATYLKDVKAIVTDEGGITCHAAIISRELKKPCIVGTMHATKLLKNNDTIELDLSTGNIHIL